MAEGKRFSLTYLDRGEPERDSARFRRRISTYFVDRLDRFSVGIARYLEVETGAHVRRSGYSSPDVQNFILQCELRDILDSITLIYRYLTSLQGTKRISDEWFKFINRVLSEENLGYKLDSSCGVHYFIDEEFERNRFSTLSILDGPDFGGVRTAFEDAFRHMDSSPPDTKASVRSIFESIEILTKQLVETRNLNKYAVEKLLKPLVVKTFSTDPTQEAVLSELFDGFAKWVDGMHNYRHGQPGQEPVAPSIEVTVYILSTGSSFLRLLAELKNKLDATK